MYSLWHIPICISSIVPFALSLYIRRVIEYVPREQRTSYVAPRYNPWIGPLYVRWEDYTYGSQRLVIGSHAFSKTKSTFKKQVVCRDVVGTQSLLPIRMIQKVCFCPKHTFWYIAIVSTQIVYIFVSTNSYVTRRMFLSETYLLVHSIC
jgi:hypothetical protein